MESYFVQDDNEKHVLILSILPIGKCAALREIRLEIRDFCGILND